MIHDHKFNKLGSKQCMCFNNSRIWGKDLTINIYHVAAVCSKAVILLLKVHCLLLPLCMYV